MQAMITAPYLLNVSVPIKVAADGRRWTDTLWAKDLALHTDYIKNLILVCPHIYSEPGATDVALNSAPFDRIKFVELHQPRDIFDALRHLPRSLAIMWQEARSASIVHTGFGGWPIGEGLLASPIAKLQGRFLITYVESSFWRVKDAPSARLYNRIRGAILEQLYRLCVKSADLKLFTSNEYLKEFLPHGNASAYVRPATWIDEEMILTDDSAIDTWNKKCGPIRVLFAGRLNEDKGVRLLLNAAKINTQIQISVIGSGELKVECLQAEADGHIKFVEQIPYGAEFFSFLRWFDAILVPSLSDEQPRIIFDAFSQAVPVIGSDTGGIRQLVTDNRNGRLFARGSIYALSDVLSWAANNRQTLRDLGMAALVESRKHTHRAMHHDRRNLILQHLRASGRS